MKSSKTLQDLVELLAAGTPLPVASTEGKHLAIIWPEGSFTEADIDGCAYLLHYSVQVGKPNSENANLFPGSLSFYPINITRPLQPQLEELYAEVRHCLPYIINILPPDSYSDNIESTPDSELEWFDS